MVDFSVTYWHTTASRLKQDAQKRAWMDSIAARQQPAQPKAAAVQEKPLQAVAADKAQTEESPRMLAMRRMLETSPNLTVAQINLLLNSTSGKPTTTVA